MFVDDPSDEWVLGVGPKLELDSHFPNRVNVEFVEVEAAASCGNEPGSADRARRSPAAPAPVPSAWRACSTGRSDRKVLIHLRGGDLTIEWNEANNHVYMTGPAVEVFSGEWPE